MTAVVSSAMNCTLRRVQPLVPTKGGEPTQTP